MITSLPPSTFHWGMTESAVYVLGIEIFSHLLLLSLFFPSVTFLFLIETTAFYNQQLQKAGLSCVLFTSLYAFF